MSKQWWFVPGTVMRTCCSHCHPLLFCINGGSHCVAVTLWAKKPHVWRYDCAAKTLDVPTACHIWMRILRHENTDKFMTWQRYFNVKRCHDVLDSKSKCCCNDVARTHDVMIGRCFHGSVWWKVKVLAGCHVTTTNNRCWVQLRIHVLYFCNKKIVVIFFCTVMSDL